MANNITATNNEIKFSHDNEYVYFHVYENNFVSIDVTQGFSALSHRDIVFLIAYLQNVIKHG